jgi:predicted AAA+ superfamily ATPase
MFTRLLEISPLSEHSYFLFGPRGVGKTSWLKAHFKDALTFDLLNHETYIALLGNPSRLSGLIPSDYKGWIIIDEIQKAPALLDEVHRLIESRSLRFILTGSSARKLRRQGVNLLAGRAFLKNFYPLTVKELGEAFSLSSSLLYGHLPMAINSQNPKEFLTSYIATYLKEEVMQEGLTRNIALFTKFLEVASFSQGEMLNYTQIAQDIGTNRTSVEIFFQILEDLLLATRILPFTQRAKREVVKSVKFYYFDVGVYRALRPKGPLDTAEEIDGAALETLFLQEVKALNDYFQLGYQIYFWRTRSQVEVDFVLYGEKGLLIFEVKRKSQLKTEDYKGLKTFMSDYPIAKAYLLYGGVDAFIYNDIHVIPFEKALLSLENLLKQS